MIKHKNGAQRSRPFTQPLTRSLEIEEVFSWQGAAVHCRTASLETKIWTQFITKKVHCRTGSLERHGDDTIEVRVEDETVWLIQKLIAELFD